MTLQFKFTSIANKDMFLKELNIYMDQQKLHYIIYDYNLIINIASPEVFKYNELFRMMNLIQEIENIY